MTVLRIPSQCAEGLSAGLDDSTDSGVRMRAQWRHQATVVSIRGDVDATNADRVQDFATHFVLAGNAVVLDLSGVDFFSAQGISVLIAVDDACRAAEVPWSLIAGHVVNRVLRLTNCEASLPTASSVPEALRQVTALTQARRQFALVSTTAQRHAV